MKYYSPNNWQEFVTQKYIKNIYEKISKKDYTKTFILADLFFLVLGIVLDRLYDLFSDEFMSRYLTILLVVLLVITILKFINIIFKQINKFIKWKNVSLVKDTPDEMKIIFNDIICYDIITSKSYSNLMQSKCIDSNEKFYYYIECSYYRNKVIKQLFLMIQSISDIFSENSDEIFYYNKISIARLENIIKIVKDISNSLDDCTDISNDNDLSLIKEENDRYYHNFIEFERKCKEVFYNRYY